MKENEITSTPEHLLQQDIAGLSKNKVNVVLRGLLAYEMRAFPGSEHTNLHCYYEQLQEARLKLAQRYVALGGEVAPVILQESLPQRLLDERPPIAKLVKTHGKALYGA